MHEDNLKVTIDSSAVRVETPEVFSSKSRLLIPDGFPDEVYKAVQRGMKPERSRAIVFENEKQRNATFIQKGLTKPGAISYDTLRRAANSVHIARICIDTLKKKITKTKWVIKSTDPLKEVNEAHKSKIEALLRKPNPNSETFRTLLDKMVEDLLVLDAVSLEKVRFPNGELAELHFVDSATIRPVFDQFGNQDVELPLHTIHGDEVLPVSYLQVLNNSQYGGPESGDVIAAWPKKDMIHFHASPQGAMEGFGYGLSPLEGVLSVVANLLNADNYNSTYFEEGSFPPIVLHLAGQISQRDAQAFREYMYQEMTGNFHRPAFMAGGEKMEVIDLKADSNRDMQFMEYTLFLAKLMCAAYGLSPEDIGLTDTTGSKSVSEVQKDISQAKGYGSILALFAQVINENIIQDDFGFDDIEFDWVAPDTVEPDAASQIYDRALKNGTLTLNEVREKLGEAPFGKWADEPMMLTTEGFKSLMAEDNEEEDTEDEAVLAAGEKPNKDKKLVEKSRSKTMYVSRPVKNADEIIAWAKVNGFKTTLQPKDLHVTLAFSKRPVNWDDIELIDSTITSNTSGRTVQMLGNAAVLSFQSDKLWHRWNDLCAAGCSWDYASFQPHITISYDIDGIDLVNMKPYLGPIVLGPEKRTQVDTDWSEKLTEKAVFTETNYRCWADDRGYSQPFIYSYILNGTGKVIKPPVAVNLQSQELEMQLTGELASRGLNVLPVTKMTFTEVCNLLSQFPGVLDQFKNYVSMTTEYDSEKWRAKFGGSRKFPYYLVSEYVDGYALSSPLLIADMKRDPNSYREAVKDLARLWKAEKELVLGDRRADQYIIDPNKRGFGIDYQFMGDKERWERTKDALPLALADIPELKEVFDDEVKKKGIVAAIKNLLG